MRSKHRVAKELTDPELATREGRLCAKAEITLCLVETAALGFGDVRTDADIHSNGRLNSLFMTSSNMRLL